ncbi:segregation and condensation protein A, partial [Pseudoalteromonas ostreae]
MNELHTDDVAQIREPAQQKLPLAFLHGKEVMNTPEDLYIPPDALEVILETFEGPLDLLLYLIKKHKLDILELSIFSITEQYVRYVEMMTEFQLELAGEYLVMAALLAQIKSR